MLDNLILAVLIALMTVVSGMLFVPERYKRDIFKA
jgi:hypothetical protein